ncbi:hypothetical protein PVK06_048537 [Gossypium arboreum]|uniref:Uncharacterized protein n=1 Tax=Gossypium arboreum TaxID=29729 RepID=A0ABR0MG50_GOSAR|nr:hypothetical protein PVK06_048537 [Gossypium arboreum]
MAVFGRNIVVATDKFWVQLLRGKYEIHGVLPNTIPSSRLFIGSGLLDESVRVCDMVTASRDWNWGAFDFGLPFLALHLIASVLPPSEAAGNDRIVCCWSCAGSVFGCQYICSFSTVRGLCKSD